MPLSARPALAALALTLSVACGGPPPTPVTGPRLVLLIATCTLAKDVLRPYDAQICWTPNLARLAREGVVFERHETEAGQSGCDYASIFTGTQADRHGIYHHPTRLLPESTTIAEAFAAAGWETYFWHGHPMASPELGYGQGVEPSRQYALRMEAPFSLTAGDAPTEELLAHLTADPDARAYVQMNFTVTHGPYRTGREPGPRASLRGGCPAAVPEMSEEEFQELMTLFEAHMRELQWDFDATVIELGLSPERVARLAQALELAYTASVLQLDHYVGTILSNLKQRGLLDQTLVAFTADHGEVRHREGLDFHWTHGMQLEPECLGVPWILRGPGLAPGRYPGVTRSIDVFPTLAGLVGVPVPGDAVDGEDLSPAVRGEAAPPHLVAFSHTTTLIPILLEESRGWSHFRRFFPSTDPELIWVRARDRDRTYHLRSIDGERWGLQVFDLAHDPFERTDLARADDVAQAEMRTTLERYKRRLVEGYARAGLEERAVEDSLEALRGLGYAR